MVMPKRPPTPPTPPAASVMPSMPHSHTGAWVSGALIIGLILGAVAGYYGKEFKDMIDQTTSNIQQTTQTTQEQQEVDATAGSYSDVETNPLQDVQTNPFE
jgi:uncharacterized protein HemX